MNYVVHMFSAPAYFPQKIKQLQVKKGEQARVQCTALGDTPIQIVWKISGKQAGEDINQRCSFIVHIGLQLLHRFESWSEFNLLIGSFLGCWCNLP
jgi:hypothetical protein